MLRYNYRLFKENQIAYPVRPVAHDTNYPIPLLPVALVDDIGSEHNDSDTNFTDLKFYEPGMRDNNPYLLTQEELNYLVRDLSLSKEIAAVLGSRLQQWNLLQGTRISHFRTRYVSLAAFYNRESNVCFCPNISGLMHELGY